ncbi:MAG: hypothetical protein QXV21_03370 [Candidatus Bathyarchaeia archaeon]
MKNKNEDANNTISAVINVKFKPVLIDNLEVKLLKEDERGKMFIIRATESSNYIKIHESVLDILKNFNGTKSIEEISQITRDAEIPIDIHELVKLLAEEGFLKNVSPPPKKKKNDIFSFSIKLFTLTEKHMATLKKAFSFVGSRVFWVFYAVFVTISFFLFIQNFPQIFSFVTSLMSPEGPLLPLFISSILFYVVEIAHEFAHAISYYHYGGKSAEIGLEFHFFIPFFYASTPDAIWMETRKQVMIFVSGPMASLFFAEMFTLLFIFEPTFRYIWAAHAFFWHISTLVTLSPIIKTDGYFIVQAVTRFPNLLEHGIDTLVKTLKVLVRKLSLGELKEHISQYSFSERRVLKFYIPLFPVVTCILVYVFVFTALEFGIVTVLNMTPQVITGNVYGIKPYVIWALYVSSIAFSIVGIIGTIVNTVGRRHREG